MTSSRAQINWKQIRDALNERVARPIVSFADDAERSRTILRERSTRLSLVPTSGERRDTAHFLVFSSGEARFGLHLSALREVVPLARVARVPGAAPAVHGVMSWRGEFVTVFDALPAIGLASANDAPPAYAAVFRGEAPLVAIAMGRAQGIGKFDISGLRAASEWLSRAPDLFMGATADAVAIFDTARLVARLRQDLRAA